jgi:hypothetical protein
MVCLCWFAFYGPPRIPLLVSLSGPSLSPTLWLSGHYSPNNSRTDFRYPETPNFERAALDKPPVCRPAMLLSLNFLDFQMGTMSHISGNSTSRELSVLQLLEQL